MLIRDYVGLEVLQRWYIRNIRFNQSKTRVMRCYYCHRQWVLIQVILFSTYFWLGRSYLRKYMFHLVTMLSLEYNLYNFVFKLNNKLKKSLIII